MQHSRHEQFRLMSRDECLRVTRLFVTEGSLYRDEVGLSIKKRLKPDAVPTIFPRSIHSGGKSSTPPSRRVAQKRQRQAVSNK